MIKHVLVAMVCMTVAASCSSLMGGDQQKPLAYVKDGINIHITASHDLNFYNNQAHTCVLTVYQLSQPGMFQQMLNSREGIAQLIAAEEFDKSVIGVKSQVIQPRQRAKLLLDRMEGSRYLGIVAGYYHGRKKLINYVYPVRLYRHTTFFWLDADQSPRMKINLYMGRSRMMRQRDTAVR